MKKGLKALCLIIIAAAFAMTAASVIADYSMAGASHQRLRDFMSANVWLLVLPNFISLVFALIYILKEGTKKMAFFYKGYIYTYLISQVIFILSVLGGSYSVLTPNGIPPRMIVIFMSWIIEYSMLLFLAFAPNLGKRISLLLAFIAAVMNICIIVMFFNLGFSMSILLRNISKILMIILLYLMVVAKYRDKDARGTI
ncbi:MAG: hypothetical protein K5668_08630 [Lachnospiraceae bacterium]|nr:hypothetical protein [Lachnospiraceae bacterium]